MDLRVEMMLTGVERTGSWQKLATLPKFSCLIIGLPSI